MFVRHTGKVLTHRQLLTEVWDRRRWSRRITCASTSRICAKRLKKNRPIPNSSSPSPPWDTGCWNWNQVCVRSAGSALEFRCEEFPSFRRRRPGRGLKLNRIVHAKLAIFGCIVSLSWAKQNDGPTCTKSPHKRKRNLNFINVSLFIIFVVWRERPCFGVIIV